MKYLDHRHQGKASYAPTISDFDELLPFLFCFRDIYIINPDPMDIIAPVWPLQSGCVTKGASTNHLMTLMMSDLSMRSRCRLPLMYLNTPTSLPQSSSYGILTRVHRKLISILMYFLALDMINISYTTMWWNAVARSLFSGTQYYLGLIWNIWLSAGIVILPVMTSGKSYSTTFRYSTMVTRRSPRARKSSIPMKYLSSIHSIKLVTSLEPTWEKPRSYTCQQTVIFFPPIILFATHGM